MEVDVKDHTVQEKLPPLVIGGVGENVDDLADDKTPKYRNTTWKGMMSDKEIILLLKNTELNVLNCTNVANNIIEIY